MTRRALRLAAAALVLLTGCTVPPLEDLGEKQCDFDAGRRCITPYQCIASVCRIPGGGACTPGATEPCGKDAGECILGTRTCGADGQWSSCTGDTAPTAENCDGRDNDCDGLTDKAPDGGPLRSTSPCAKSLGVCANAAPSCVDGGFEGLCTAASYGPRYEPTELSCDGLDNDCDGGIDTLPDGAPLRSTACEKQLGVCAGSAHACVGAQFEPTCAPASYGPFYEAVEHTCDSRDNDCDGLVDRSATQVLSSPGQHAAIAAIDGGYLLVYAADRGAGSHVFFRRYDESFVPQTAEIVVNAPGATAANRPVIAPFGQSGVLAAWVENFGSDTRLMLTKLDRDGNKFINNLAGAALPLLGRSTNPIGDIAIALNTNESHVLVTWVEDTGGGPRIYGTTLTSDGVTQVKPETVIVGAPTDGGTELVLELDARAGISAPFVIAWASQLNGRFNVTAITVQVDLTRAFSSRTETGNAGTGEPRAVRVQKAPGTSNFAANVWIEQDSSKRYAVRGFVSGFGPGGLTLTPFSTDPITALDTFANGDGIGVGWITSAAGAGPGQLRVMALAPPGATSQLVATLPAGALSNYLQITNGTGLHAAAFELDAGTISLQGVNFCGP